jgi:hypothetical protein
MIECMERIESPEEHEGRPSQAATCEKDPKGRPGKALETLVME